MRQLYTLTLLALVFSNYAIKAQNFHLIKDIEPLTNSNPSNRLYSSNNNVTYPILNGKAYFSADDGVHGAALWSSDGTADGTVLVKEIIPGQTAINIENIFIFNNKLFFNVIKPDGSQQLWSSDGSTANTVLVKDSIATAGSNAILDFEISGNYFYFFSSANYLSQKLWKSDGTTMGTVVVADLYTPDFGYAYGGGYLIAYKEKVFFNLYNNYGNELWVSDGTKAGTQMLKDINPGAGDSYPGSATVAGNSLFFHANDGSGEKLFKSDGTEAGTHAVTGDDNLLIVNDGFDVKFAVIKSTLFFMGYNKFGVLNLYRFNINDSAVGYSLVKQLHPYPGSYYYSFPVIALKDSLLYFVAYNDQGNHQLWATTGTPEACVLLKTTGNKNIAYFGNFNDAKGQFYFTCYDDNVGSELYTSDGTPSGTKLVKDINPGVYSSFAGGYLTYLDKGKILFNANDGVAGHELWVTDGTSVGTAMVKDINKTTTGWGGLNTFYPFFHSIINNNELLSFGVNERYGAELWRTNGTPAGTKILKDVNPGNLAGFSTFSNLQRIGDDYYYFSYSVNDTLLLWKTDGTSQNYVNTDKFAGYSDENFYYMAAGTTQLYFIIYNKSTYRFELWVKKSTAPAKLILPNVPFSYGYSLVTIGDRLYFLNRSNAAGLELWTSDGTTTGTNLVKDITPGPNGTDLNNFTAFNNKLYFTAHIGDQDHIWATDGTDAGTYQVSNANVIFQQYDLINFFKISGNKFYFIGSDSTHGEELWVSDGTGTGTKMVKDIMPGAANAGISNITDVNGAMYFTADDGVHGSELWKTNGTAETTHLVKDITPGSQATPVAFLVNGNGIACFVVNNKLWVSNGTSEGTKPVEDNVLNGLTNIGYLVPAGDQLFLNGYNYKYGYESYAGTISSILPVRLLSFTGNLVKNDAALAWKTTNEINNSYFIVQRSLDGAAFSNVGSVAAANNQAAVNNYTFTDADVTALNANALYYRLQQVDKDGKSTLSNIVKLDIASFSGITISPNPAHKTAYIRSSITINNALVMLTDMNGHVLYTAKQNIRAGAQVPVNIERLAAGTYNVTLQAAGVATKQFKLVIQ